MHDHNENLPFLAGLPAYDYYIVAFSGGKDSIASFLHLIEELDFLGIPRSRIELWHHCIDGKEGSTLMDWPITPDYCRKFANAFGVKYYESWKTGGFEGEMLRENALTASKHFEYPYDDDNIIECGIRKPHFRSSVVHTREIGGDKGKKNTRRKFPQVSADLRTRWCSAYLKIDVCTAAINNQPRFRDKRTIVLTGERAEESSARAKYKHFEPDRSDNRDGKKIKRHVDHWRPVLHWKEKSVWSIIEKHRVVPHPAYRLGWGRLSCIACIFGSANQWASINAIDPARVTKIADYEKEFGVTIHRKLSVPAQVAKGTPYEDTDLNPHIIKQGLSKTYTHDIILPSSKTWELPAGAFGESTGPS